jgi:hypothetical protein
MKRIRHLSKPKGETKYIRINDKTIIEVEVNVSEETARENYLLKTRRQPPVKGHSGMNEFIRNVNSVR